MSAAEAKHKLLTARRSKVSAGLDELERWLADQVRTGLATLPRAGYSHVDAVAARMVDAQAPGVAGMLRGIPGDLVGEDWPERALHRLGRLHLLVQAHRGLDDLPDDLAATVRSRVGYPAAKADVLATPGVFDHWYALGSVDTVEYHLESRRVWLLGATTGRWALWLTFAPPGQDLDSSVLPGQVLAGDLHFYAGSGQFRALVGERHQTGPTPGETPPEPPGVSPAEGPLLRVVGGTLADAQTRYAELLAADPWASRMPVLIRGVPVRPDRGEPWRFRDESGVCCPIDRSVADLWPLLAQSCGEPLTLFGEWQGDVLLPLTVLSCDDARQLSVAVAG